MSIDHAKQMELPGATVSGYIRSETYRELRELFGLPANDDTDNGRFVLQDGSSRVFVASFTDMVEDNAYVCKYGIEGEEKEEAGLHKSRAGIGFQAFLEHVKETSLNILDPSRVVVEGESADTASTDGAGDELGKSETETEPMDTTAPGESTPAPVAADPAESATSEPETAPEATASSTGKKSKKSNAEPAE